MVLRGGLRCFFRRPMRPARGRKVMDSDAAPECDVSLSTDFKSHDVESAEGRRRELRRAQIAVLLLSRFLLQLSGSRSSPSCCIRNLPDEQRGLWTDNIFRETARCAEGAATVVLPPSSLSSLSSSSSSPSFSLSSLLSSPSLSSSFLVFIDVVVVVHVSGMFCRSLRAQGR